MEDRLLPMLRKSGVMNVSVTLFHTTWMDGRSIRKLLVTGITSLEQQRSKVTSRAFYYCCTWSMDANIMKEDHQASQTSFL